MLYIGKEFYFRGCGWKVKWSMDDMKWMQEMCSLFDKLFGPDKFQFKTSKKCLVIPKQHQPSFIYDHSIWEQQFQLPEIKSQTAPWTDSKARCSLNKVFKEVKVIKPVDSSKIDVYGFSNRVAMLICRILWLLS